MSARVLLMSPATEVTNRKRGPRAMGRTTSNRTQNLCFRTFSLSNFIAAPGGLKVSIFSGRPGSANRGKTLLFFGIRGGGDGGDDRGCNRGERFLPNKKD